MLARLEEVAVYDEEGRVEGMQFDGKARRMQQWREKKEDEEFEALIAKLRQKKKYRAWYDRHKDDPNFREKMREQCRAMKAKHGSKWNANDREKRREDAEKNPVVNKCEECGKEFVREYGFKKKRTAKFCSKNCRNRNAHKKRDRNRGARKGEVLALLKIRYAVTAIEAHQQLDMSLAMARGLLNALVNEGVVKKYDEESPFRYSIW